jgi:signal transduction histidine kinase
MFKKEPQKKVLVDVNGPIRDVLALLQAEFDRKRVLLQTDLGSDLPKVRAEPAQLQQVFLNLFMNAVDAMNIVTGRERTLKVTSAPQMPNEVLVSIEDSGPGIDPNIMDRIFNPFFTTKSQGMGMGLSICRSIIESHSGRLQVAPGATCGTAFQAVLPTAGVGPE